MSLCRQIFLLFNPGYFVEVGLNEFLHGIRFDLLAGSFALLPIFFLIGIQIKLLKTGLSFIKFYFNTIIGLFTMVNCIDVIYFKFTLKRTTWDIFRYVSTGDEVTGLIPQFLKDYWYISLIWITLVILSFYLSKKVLNKYTFKKESRVTKISYFTFMLLLIFLGLRGGFQLKPLNIMDASRYTISQNIPLILNTPFTLMKTIGKEHLEKQEFFEEDVALGYFNPLFIQESDTNKFQKNVVVIIMESLSKEYVGFYNNGIGFTPFLDSLMSHSTVFTNAYANGKRSIEALPAIFSGLPNLMNEAHNTTPYAGNKLNSLASILGSKGYTTSFYHGGKNGTMGFNSYTNLAKFDFYYGLDEYPNSEDYDGGWGIYDVPYFQYFAYEQSKMEEPFFSSIFSLSAHHPYKLPVEYKENCVDGTLPIHPMICYSDIALRKYFTKVKHEDWYNRTIFLITADHTAQSTVDIYGTSMGIFSIPIVLFDPSTNLGQTINKTTQQADITPTLLNALKTESKAVFFGQSAIDNSNKGFAINYLSGMYQFIDDKFCIHFDGENAVSVYDYTQDPMLKMNLIGKEPVEYTSSLNKLKTIIQLYNQRMIENKLTVYD